MILSPFLLGVLKVFDGTDWARLSEIGQTYGAISAVLSALALGAVAVSVAIQARQAKADQIQAVRGFHLDLVRMQLDDLPTYLPCWGPLDLPSPTSQRRHIYTNLVFSYGSMGYNVGEISEPWLRDMLGGMFQGESARRYWLMARTAWIASAGTNRRGRRFVGIVDDEYRRAEEAGPPVIAAAQPTVVQAASTEPERQVSASIQKSRGVAAGSLLLGAGVGVLIGLALDRRQRGGRRGR
ncbi:DUF6082 family protein [Rugosimonospora acidiphila]|uniref:DUF6082 family protein n=1 Tax=Rugosimonospora acidiphila TaxID=556531 RepID=UPI0031E4FFF7